jgi:serine/threonine protein kinase
MDDAVARQIELLKDRGDYRAAAVAYEDQGELGAARDLYEKLFDYGEAARIAELQGDDLRAIDICLQGGLHAGAETIRQRLMANLSEHLSAAGELFAARDYHGQAAEIAESLGQLQKAAEHYRQASNHARCAILLERLGRVRAAGEAWERQLVGDPDDHQAQVGLGRVLQRFGRHKEALESLTSALGGRAVPHEIHREASRRVAYSFFKLGLEEAGWTALTGAGFSRGHDPAEFCRPIDDELQGMERTGEEAAGTTLEGRYRVERPLETRAGAQYLARDLLSGTPVVVQFIPGHKDEHQEFYGGLDRLRETEVPSAVRLLEINRESGFVVTSFHGEVTLADTLHSDNPPTPLQARSIAKQLVHAMNGAHRAGVLHGALSPRCIWMTPFGGCVAGGWGNRHLEKSLATRTGGADSAIAYRAPELAIGRPADLRADLYSIAAVLYRCLTGDAPGADPRPPTPGCPEEFRMFFRAALSEDPSERPASGDELLRSLEDLPWMSVFLPQTAGPEPTVQSEQEERYETLEADHDGEGALVRDRLLDRQVRKLSIPEAEDRTTHLVDRLDVLAGPEHPVFQEILRYHTADGTLILEHLSGTPVGEMRSPLTTDACIDAAERLMRGLAAAHKQGVGVGTVNPQSVVVVGGALRLPIAASLLLTPDGDPARIEEDCRGFWEVFAGLLQANCETAGPTDIVATLAEQGLISPPDRTRLTDSSTGGISVVAHLDWFQELRRALDAQAVRQHIFDRVEALAREQAPGSQVAAQYLAERRADWGL